MARISNKQVYKIVDPTASDYVIGTDAEDLNKTKTFTMQGIADFVGGNVTVGVGSLNGLVGAVTLSAGVGLVLTENGNDLTLSLQTPDFVESVNGLDGVLNVQGSTNIGVTDNGTDTITLTALNVAKTNEANTFTNDQTLNKSLSVAGGVFDVDFDTQRVGVNNPTPLYPLDIVGDTNITGTTGDVLTLNSPSEVGENYILFNNSLGTDKGWVGYRGASDVLQLRSLLGSVNIIADTSVTLSYGGVTRLETTGSGVEITGDLTAGDVTASSIIITGGASSDFLKADGSLDGTTYQDVTERGQADGYAPLNSLSKIENTFLPNDLERTTNKGAANGYAPLDSGAKIPLVNIPDSILGQVTYEGTWDANNNLPLLTNPPAADTKGEYYVCSSDGTQFGITFQTGDWIISNGTAWEKVDNTDAVTKVFNRIGNIIALESDYDSFYATLLGNNFFDAGTNTFNDGLRTNRGLKVNPNRLLPSGNNKDFTIDSISGTNILSSGQNYFGFNDDNNIFFQRDSNLGGKGGQLEWNNTDDRAYTLPDASGTFALANLDNNFSVDQTFQGNIAGQQASFTNNGIVGVLALDVLGDSRFIVGDFHVGQNTSSPDLFVKRTTGETGLGTFNPSAKLDVVGTTELNGNTTINGDLNIDGGKITIDTTAIVGREDILLSTVSDTSLSKFGIANGTAVSTEFTPQFYGYQHVDRQALIFSGYGNAAYDLITSDPLVSFVVSNTNNSTNPLAGTLTAITQRPVFNFGTTDNSYLRILPSGYIGLGNNTSPTEMLDVTGNVKATSFIGSGASLTSLNASNITTGTLSDARLSSNVALKDIDNNFSVGQTIGGNTTINGLLTVTAINRAILLSGNRAYLDMNDGVTRTYIRNDSTEGYAYYVSTTGEHRFNDNVRLINNLQVDGTSTFNTNTTINGNLTVDTDTLFVDASADRVGINTSSPSSAFTVFQNNQVGSNEFLRLTTGGGGTSGTLSIGIYPTSNKSFGFIGSNANYTSGGIARIDTGQGASLLALNNDSIVFYTSVGAIDPTERVKIDSSGNVGIGTNNPSGFSGRILHIHDSSISRLKLTNNTTGSTSTDGFEALVSGSDVLFVNRESGNMTFSTSATERMRIDSSGNTTINGNLRINKTSGGHIELRDTDSAVGNTSNYIIGRASDGSSDSIVGTVSGTFRIGTYSNEDVEIRVGNDPKLVVKSSGNTTINGDLKVSKDKPIIELRSQENKTWTVGETISSLDFYSADSSGGGAGVKSQIRSVAENTSGAQVGLVFATENTTDGLIDKMKIDSSGNVGIGTSSPSATLDVNGSLSKNSGSFKIDHPLPEKKDTHHLVHSFVEAPQADNIYRGKIDLVDGKATVNLDEAGRMTEGTFVLLNGNIQCFTSNESGWTAIRGTVEGNTLTIEAQDAECTDTVSWLVIGERIDQHMIDTEWTDENGRVITEPLKQVEPAPDEEEITE